MNSDRRTFTPGTPDAFAGYLSLLEQKPVPRVAIDGFRIVR
jgi:hypothetical protein